ncbi:hypothetical protein Cgig2_029586 [Carnegiea gigantea]|uniref:Uncharacterized protein n=1 Tax=Carnegiea gigantea TaxID=171969 RepID=A0A9Q1JYE8_9CARY|nr:hypothetical protein Cgig2_029586 [Carnegiea gigantea]
MGDSDEPNEDISNEDVQFIGAVESRSLLRTRDAQIQNALAVLRIREEDRAQSNHLFTNREHLGVAARSDFKFAMMEYISPEEDANYFIIFDNEDMRRNLHARGFKDNLLSTLFSCVHCNKVVHSNLKVHTKDTKDDGGAWGKVHTSVLYGNRPDFYQKLLHLK